MRKPSMRTKIAMTAIAALLALGAVQFGAAGWQLTDDSVDLPKRGADCIKNCG